MILIFLLLLGYTQGSSSSSRFSKDPNLIPAFNSSREARRSVVSGGLFSIVSFDNVPCGAVSGDIGTCYSQRECTNLGGTASGICAGNFGVCCVITPTCGSTITTNNTYFVNPGYPNPVMGPLQCSVTINKLTGATELYLEFTSFQIAGPTLGNCLNDTFIVSVGSSGTKIPTLCGNVGDQMYYIGISNVPGPFTLTFTLSNSAFLRNWKIRIVQFLPGDACASPAGCSLYFRDPSGVVETFNFNSGQGELINNICETICFALAPGYCSILLTENQFMLGGTAPNDCGDQGDYLLANGQQFCGDSLGTGGMLIVNTTTTMDYVGITVCSGSSNAEMNLGFNLNYTQLPCSMMG